MPRIWQSHANFSTNNPGQRHARFGLTAGEERLFGTDRCLGLTSAFTLTVAFQQVDVAQARSFSPIWSGYNVIKIIYKSFNTARTRRTSLQSRAEYRKQYHNLITWLELGYRGFPIVTLFHSLLRDTKVFFCQFTGSTSL